MTLDEPVIDPPGTDATEDVERVDPALVEAVAEALETGAPVDPLVEGLHAADLADLFEELPGDHRLGLLQTLGTDLQPEVLTHLDDAVREDVVAALSGIDLADAIVALDTDDAVEVFEDLEEDQQAEVLEQLSPSDRALLEEALTWPEDSAGRLMQRELVTVPVGWSVGDTIDYMRARAAHLPRDFYDIFVVDDDRQPLGLIPLSRLMRNRRPIQVADILHTDLHLIPLEMDQEDVAFLFRQYGLVSAPVVNDAGRLVGVITVDDVVDVIHEEHEEDLMRLGGIGGDDFYHDVLRTTRLRFSWLLANLGTAIVASIAIGLFDAAIEQVVALAILMPIVASMGGNAGTQALTVSVRALAMKELNPSNALRIIGKELLVGGINGVLFAVLTGVVAWLWFGSPMIGAIIAVAMVINLIVAAVAGVAIPVFLDRLGIDPAIGSTVILTTVTDVVGFVAFLGLAAIVLL